MKAQRMPGLLCRSDISTSVCVPGDPRSVVMVPRRPEHWAAADQARLIDLKYSRHPHPRRAPSRDPRRSTMSLPTVTKRGRNPPKAALVPPLPPSSDHVFQVVVMRVSLHCQGCAGKLRKHISKMEGVTSFSIDLESKRVTVMGHVSPVVVLESVSKVKKAEFWPC